MAKKKNFNFIYKVLILGGLIVAAQLFFLFKLKQEPEAQSNLKDIIKNSQFPLPSKNSAKTNEDNEKNEENRKIEAELMKIKMALTDFRIKNNKYPETLDTLIPEYFRNIPIDPRTSEPVAYQLFEDTYRLGANVVIETPTPDPTPPIDPDNAENEAIR